MASYDFTYGQEVGTGKHDSKRPHKPSDDSGVTIGPGYDMKEKGCDEIITDLTSVGVSKEEAEKFAGGSKLKGKEAEKWKNANKNKLSIDDSQQKRLYNEVLINKYENRVKNRLKEQAENQKNPDREYYDWEKLDDTQKEMLFDYEYNVGLKKFPSFFNAVVKKDYDKALKEHVRLADGKPLVKRNNDFFNKYLKTNPFATPPQSSSPNSNINKSIPADNFLPEGFDKDMLKKAPLNMSEIPNLPELSLPSLPGFSVGFPAARLTDNHFCPMVTPGLPPVPHVGGPITGPCVPTVIIGNMFAATVGDMCVCVGPPDSIIKGSTSVLIGGKLAARMFDNCAHGGMIVTGYPTVLIGDAPSPITVMAMKAAAAGIGFIENCLKQ